MVMEVLTTEEVVKRIKPSLLLPKDFTLQDDWIEAQVSDLSLILQTRLKRLSEGKLKLEDGEIPKDLFYVIKNIVIFGFNRIRSEGMDTHTEGGEVMRWKKSNSDPFSEYEAELLDFVQGTDRANGFSFYS